MANSSQEVHLLEENMQKLASPVPDLSTNARHLATKKTLHSIMSHLQRYKTELQRTEDIVRDLQTMFRRLYRTEKSAMLGEEMGTETTVDENLIAITNQFSALRTFLSELETKTGNIMELVNTPQFCEKVVLLTISKLSDVVKSRDDMLLISNGSVIRKLLKSARRQARASQVMMEKSQRMASDMRKDSVSMKTVGWNHMIRIPFANLSQIALLTMAFLPATSVAVRLFMPTHVTIN